MAITLTEMTNQDKRFYPTMGPFLANKDVHKALGGVPWDEDTKTWIVAKRGRKVVGFCAINQGSKRTLLESLYAVDDNPEVIATLVAAAVERYGHDRDLHTTVRTDIVDHYTNTGFAVAKEKTNFVTLVRGATIRKETR